MAEHNSFIVHFESFKYFSRLKDEELGALFRALCSFAENGTEPDFNNPVIDIIFEMIRERMVRDAEKYNEMCEKNARNGRKGGRPRKTERFSEKPRKADSECECERDPECESDPDCVPVCEREPDAAHAADFPHTPHTADELTVEWVLTFAGAQGYLWTQEEAERFIAYNRDRGRRDGWDYAVAQWEKNRPRMEKLATPAKEQESMNKYLQFVNRFREDDA